MSNSVDHDQTASEDRCLHILLSSLFSTFCIQQMHCVSKLGGLSSVIWLGYKYCCLGWRYFQTAQQPAIFIYWNYAINLIHSSEVRRNRLINSWSSLNFVVLYGLLWNGNKMRAESVHLHIWPCVNFWMSGKHFDLLYLCQGVYSFRLNVRNFVAFVELLQSFTLKQLEWGISHQPLIR